MAKQWTMQVLAGGRPSPNRAGAAYVPTGVAVAADSISLYIGDTVSPARQVEIVDGWKWLYQGVRDRNLLDAQFKGAVLYTASDINKMTTADRRTSSDLVTYTDNDVILAIGAGVTALGEHVAIEEAFRILRHFALEETLKAL